MTKEKMRVLTNLTNTYARLKPSDLEGVGVFAVRDIPKNTKVFQGIPEQKWFRLSMSELRHLDRSLLKMIDDFFVIEKDETVSIPESALNGMDMSFYVNHSQTPNLKTIDGGYTFVTIRDIKDGEELTVCYGDYDYKYRKLKEIK